MDSNPKELLKELKAGKLHPVYFLQGEEPFYIDQISNYIEENVLEESQKSFNQTILYGKDIKISDVLNNARRFPMMSEKQVVIIKEAQSISDINKDSGQKLLSDYLQNPTPSTILVFCHKNKNVDKRKSLYKNLKKTAVIVETKKLFENQVPAWIKERVAEKGLKINEKAVMMLAQNIGMNLERINNELDKISINLKSDLIDDEAVQKFVGISRDYNAFELQRALAHRDLVKAKQIGFYLGENKKESPVFLTIGLLFSFFSKVLKMHGVKAPSEKALMTSLGVGYLADYKVAFKNYSKGELVSIIGFLRIADLQCKGIDYPSLSDLDIYKELISKIAG